MITVERSVLVAHPASDMRALVENVESYPEFLPWCGEARVLERRGDEVVAALTLDFRGIRQTFATANAPDGAEGLRMKLVSGPFRRLDGLWQFRELAPGACKVSLRLDYEFSSPLLGKVVGPIFNQVASSLVEAFVQRADRLSAEGKFPLVGSS